MLAKVSAFAALVAAVLAHREMTYPCPRFSPHCATTPNLPPGISVDYNESSEIGDSTQINLPICRYTTPWPQVNEVWTAGQSVTVSFLPGEAAHGGGHCEFSVSYDGGNTFAVVHRELQYCFFTGPSSSNSATVNSYTFNLPQNLPGSNHVVFAWSWVNAIGPREFYTNCADIAIIGSAGSYTGTQMVVANYGANSTFVPDFGTDYTTGLSLYQNAPNVIVTGSGYGSGSGSTTTTTSAAASTTSTSSTSPATSTPPSTTTSSSSSAPVSTTTSTTSSAASTTTTSTTSTTTTSSAPASTSSATSGGGSGPVAGGNCSSEGAYQCADTTGKNANYFLCLYGKWIAQACSAGTACFQSGSSVSCGWPQ